MLIASRKDICGMNIAKKCEELGLNVHYINEDITTPKNLPKSEFYIFLSRHESSSKKPCLTVHFPGNFSGELGISFPTLEKKYVRNLWKIRKEWDKKELEKYEIVIEATHHGPTHFKNPVMFVEIGSSKEEWEDKTAAELVAHAVRRTLHQTDVYLRHTIAFGGTHYPKKFTNILIKDIYSIGHVMPKYALKNLNEKIFEEMIKKSVEKIKYCLIDWKGCVKKNEIIELAKKFGLEVIKV